MARFPVAKRSQSKLLCLTQNGIAHRHFHNVIDLINEGDLLVMNDTKVIPARLFGHKTSGGVAELLVERILDDSRILAQVRVSKPARVGDYLLFPNEIRLEVVGRYQQFYELRYNEDDYTILEIIESIGQVPIPPYFHRSAEESDKERYQTIYAKHKGSAAAPTAGFHFDDELMQKIVEKKIQLGYLTLHIGAGTFMPVRVDDIREHKMHTEYLEVSQDLCNQIKATKAAGKRVISVGTTSLRALETACQSGTIEPYHGETNIFIYPGYQFHSADALITNFHLPCSTLLMLVCAFGGYEQVMNAYREAVAKKYRFYSYGDAMWVDRVSSLSPNTY